MRAYGDDLAQFRPTSREELGREPRPADVDHLLIRAFLARLHRAGLKKTSAARKLASLRTFFRYLCREGILERNPARALLSPRLERRIPSHLDERRGRGLLDVPGDAAAAAARPGPSSSCCTPPASGARSSWAWTSRRSTWAARMVRVLGKGRKERIVPFGTPGPERPSRPTWPSGQASDPARPTPCSSTHRGGRLTDR